MLKLLFTTIILICLHFSALGQTQNTDTSKVKTVVNKTAKVASEDVVVDGFWAVSEYFGKKLADELGNRMNLAESTEPKEVKPKKVTLKIGPIKIERVE